MKIKEYQEKFEELFNQLEAEHGSVSDLTISSSCDVYGDETTRKTRCRIIFTSNI